MPTGATAPSPAVAPQVPGRAHLPRVIAAASVALALTAPGQTAAVSVFVDPLIHDLGVSRSAVSTAYLIGSLSGAFVMPVLGRLIDRCGPRRVMAVIALCFGAVLIVSTAASEITGLTAAFIGIRVGGQGALNLVATTTVAIYVHRRRGFATGVASAVGTAGISLAPMLLERLVSDWGWRQVWLIEGLAVCALVTTGLNFHQVSLLGERGLSPAEAAATFLPQTIAGLIATFGLGWLADRFSDRMLIIVTMTVLALATAGAGWLTPGFTAVLYGLALGACANGIRTLEAVAFPRCFGLRHLGVIRGVVHSVTVGASAFGPLLLALGREQASSYRPILLVATVLPLAVTAAGALVRTPPPVPPDRE